MKHIVIAGGNGYLGRKLKHWLVRRGYKVSILTRNPDPNDSSAIYWDGQTSGPWTDRLEGCQAIVNLAGKSVNCRYHLRNKAEILRSRVNSTRIIGAAIRDLEKPPEVWINASTATIYEASFSKPWNERNEKLDKGFSASVAKSWEDAFLNQETPGTRKVAIRTSLVLGNGANSALKTLRKIARFGLGGKIASGEQMFSWIHEQDFTRAIEFLINLEDLDGVFNLTSPAPVDNATFMKTLREQLKVTFGIPTPKRLLAIGSFLMRTEPELVLKSRYVVPTRLLENRFQFEYPFIDEALDHLLANWDRESMTAEQVSNAPTAPYSREVYS